MKHIGKKGKSWNNARRKLKQTFLANQITRCELCGSDFALSFSHSVKRRYITTESELLNVILLCGRHHSWIENHPEKIEIHNRVIENRGKERILESEFYRL